MKKYSRISRPPKLLAPKGCAESTLLPLTPPPGCMACRAARSRPPLPLLLLPAAAQPTCPPGPQRMTTRPCRTRAAGPQSPLPPPSFLLLSLKKNLSLHGTPHLSVYGHRVTMHTCAPPPPKKRKKMTDAWMGAVQGGQQLQGRARAAAAAAAAGAAAAAVAARTHDPHPPSPAGQPFPLQSSARCEPGAGVSGAARCVLKRRVLVAS
jgi:hypothetical protein